MTTLTPILTNHHGSWTHKLVIKGVVGDEQRTKLTWQPFSPDPLDAFQLYIKRVSRQIPRKPLIASESGGSRPLWK